MRQRLAHLAVALWWGSLTTIGFVAVPLLFAHLPTAAMAGQMAARLFTAQTWISVACGAVLLISLKDAAVSSRDDRRRTHLLWVVAGLLLALLLEYAVAPHIRARENLRLWHSAGTLMYALQWLCVLTLLWRLNSRWNALEHPSP
ncbi:DUF4149 domain-containing protein [Ottowia sp.]|uniref:DUF4149 domain-containing protein n=1 Tax=Ottowia sp. TaxID=1898956 RepID=UPI003A862B81